MGDEIRRRWNKPPEWGYVKENPNELFVLNGELRGGIVEGLTQDTVARIKEGRLCIICKEPQSRPFPDVCELAYGGRRLCGFPIRKHQLRYFNLLFQGEAKLGRDYGPSVKLDDEIDRLDAELEQDNWEDNPSRGIVVPARAKH